MATKINQKATFFVAVNGDDGWSGKLSEPNAGKTDGPFATLHHARDAVRELKKQAKYGLKEPVTIMVRGGKYYFDRTLDLTKADSGTPQAPIIYTAYPGESPVISGGKRIRGWGPYKGNILKCNIPEAKGGAWKFRQLFADGERQVRARYPNLDPKAKRWNGKWAYSQAIPTALDSSEPFIVWKEPNAFPHSWAKPSQGELFLLPLADKIVWPEDLSSLSLLGEIETPVWGDSSIIGIKSIDTDKGIIRLVHGWRTFDKNPWYLPLENNGCQFVVENILEELDQPGEWCLDSEDGVLYFWPLKDFIDNMEVVAPVLKCIIHLRGAADVRISGFVFTETQNGEPSSHYTDVEGTGAQSPQMDWEYCGETIYLNMCTDCYIEDNKISGVGGNGIYMRNHNERNVIRGNEISYAGSNGIVLAGGRHNIFQASAGRQMGTQGTPHPTFNEITDNDIHNCGLYDTYAAGVFMGLSNWNRITHNEIHDLPHHGINLGNSRYGRNFVEYNKISRTCQFTSDNGAINCWHEMPPEIEPPGHVIRHNFITDTGNQFSDVTMGIYLDNWSSNCLVYGNIIINTLPSGRGIAILAKGINNIIENNILVNSGASFICVMAHCNYPEFDTVVLRNIMYDPSGKKESFFNLADHEHLWKVLSQSDYNLFFGAGTNPMVIEGIPLSDWHKMYRRQEDVYDIHSIVADPLFVDAAKGDYRLKPESPALKLGFRHIDVNEIGIRIKKTE